MSICCSKGLRLWPFMVAKVRVAHVQAWTLLPLQPLT